MSILMIFAIYVPLTFLEIVAHLVIIKKRCFKTVGLAP